MRAVLAAFLSFFPASALAGPPTLSFPLDCTLGETCFVQQYVDRDATSDSQDFTCGPLSYDGHKGTDIRLPHYRDILGDGVQVRASASGVVLGTRNSMRDIVQGAKGAPDISGRECGNGVVIDHGQGWHTQYCHMRQGSISVSTGQSIQQGQALGLVGLSGKTEFPHLHVKVSKDGKVIDPFDINDNGKCGKTSAGQLWQPPIPYQPGGFLSADFASVVPSFPQVKQGLTPVPVLPKDALALIVWGFLFGVLKNDILEININFPDGTTLFKQARAFERNQAQAYRLGGKRLTKSSWPTGEYLATLTLLRDGAILSKRALSLTVQ